MNQMVKASAPGKLLLFGEHAVVYGKPCIVTAVNQRIYVSIRKRHDDKIIVNAEQVGIREYYIKLKELGKNYPREVAFVLKAVENFFKKYDNKCGLSIKTYSEFSSKFGFGSSAASTVATLKAMSKLFEININDKELFDLGYKTVLDIQGVGSGFDIASSIYGGTIYFIKGGKTIEKIKTGKLPIIVGYTGIKADTTMLVKKVALLRKRHPELVGPVFNLLQIITDAAKKKIKSKDYVRLGELMDFNHGLLNAAKVSSIELEQLVDVSRKAGALGAKLSGAGGGDCMIALVNRNKTRDVEKAIEYVGGKVIDVEVGAPGVRIEK